MSADDAVANLDKIDHIVVLMMENRSFDHMLGFLTIDSGRRDVDGIEPGMANEHEGQSYPVHKATSTKLSKARDPCHSGACVDEQVANGMGGFVANFVKTRKDQAAAQQGATVMAYHTAAQLPVYD
jgi:phospholipase C